MFYNKYFETPEGSRVQCQIFKKSPWLAHVLRKTIAVRFKGGFLIEQINFDSYGIKDTPELFLY